MLIEADEISVKTRAQALEDGALVDAGDLAREAGFRVPVAYTRAAWESCVEWTEADDERKGTLQDVTGRAWDVLNMARFAAQRVGGSSAHARFTVCRIPREGRSRKPSPVELLMNIGRGDHAEPVITIMTPQDVQS